jgi:calpain-15
MLGAPISLRIDDYIPTYNSYTTTLFSKVYNRGVWVSVLEKAFAKLNGNYSALIGGWPEEAINSILGTP